MKYKIEDRLKILEYKFIFEEEIQVKKEYQEGSADLSYRLSFFRDKLDNQKGIPEQKNIFDSIFLGNDCTEIEVKADQYEEEGLVKSALKAKEDIKPWAKKMYKKKLISPYHFLFLPFVFFGDVNFINLSSLSANIGLLVCNR